MYLSLPLEVRRYRQLDLNDTSSDRLYVSLQLKSRELMHELMNDLAHFRELDDLSNLLSGHVIEVRPSELFLLFNLPQDLLGYAVILSQRGH